MRAVGLLLLAVLSCRSRDRLPGQASGSVSAPGCDLRELRCTGLYGPAGAGWALRQIPADVRPYEPGLQLWSDGLEKQRYVQLPPGARIDTGNMDEWVFPVGTKFWKEFRWKGRRIETRFLWKRTAQQWFRNTYRWSDDGRQAVELTRGELNVPGTAGYEIPTQSMCNSCHGGKTDGILGFEALSLSLARPDAGLTLEQLRAEGRLTQAPAKPLRLPGTPTESAALGYLHMNCGVTCHSRNPGALGANLEMDLRLEVSELEHVEDTGTYRTALEKPPVVPWPELGAWRASRREPGESAIVNRMKTRVPQEQMPPLATHVVDTAGVGTMQRWLESAAP